MSDETWCEYCNNLGTVECLCGGDLCICENYGEMDCPICHGMPWSEHGDDEEDYA